MQDELQEAIQEILDSRGNEISTWEDDFLHDILEKLESGYALSEGQVEKIEEILENYS